MNRPVKYPPMIAEAMRVERNFWQMVAILTTIAGIIFGAVLSRVDSHQRQDHRICVAPALVALQHTEEQVP